MKNSLITLAIVGVAAARPTGLLTKREVPQEHAHRNVNLAVNELLQQNNPDNIQDPLFALLGAKAAAEGAGNIADTGQLLHGEYSCSKLIVSRLPSASCC